MSEQKRIEALEVQSYPQNLGAILDMMTSFAQSEPDETQMMIMDRWLLKSKAKADVRFDLLKKSYFVNIALLPVEAHQIMTSLAVLAKRQYDQLWQQNFKDVQGERKPESSYNTTPMIRLELTALDERLKEIPFERCCMQYSILLLYKLLQAQAACDCLERVAQFKQYAGLFEREYRPRIRMFFNKLAAFMNEVLAIMPHSDTQCLA